MPRNGAGARGVYRHAEHFQRAGSAARRSCGGRRLATVVFTSRVGKWLASRRGGAWGSATSSVVVTAGHRRAVIRSRGRTLVMASPPADDQITPGPARTNDRPSLLIDNRCSPAVAGRGRGHPRSRRNAVRHGRHGQRAVAALLRNRALPRHPRPDVARRMGLPPVATTGALVHPRLRMPVSAVVQSLFALACAFLAVIGTRMLLS